jgi:hypothetical protein
MQKSDFRGIAVAVVVFALGIIAVGFTGCDFLEDYVNMKDGEKPPYTVTDVNLTPYVGTPVGDGTPTSDFVGSQYSGQVEWSPAPAGGTFVVGTPYTATVTLTAASDWTFTGVAENAFTHSDALAPGEMDPVGSPNPVNVADSGVVTIVFKATEAAGGGGGESIVPVFFSGVFGTEDSIIDVIRAAKQAGKDNVSPTWTGANEEVTLSEERDLGTTGLVLVNSGDGFDASTNNSPKYVTINGNGREIALIGSPGSPLITVGNGVTLTLKNITFKGMDNNTRPLVLVNSGGTLIMETGATIRDNTNVGEVWPYTWADGANNSGGGVMVSGGTFKMKDGATITNNISKQDSTRNLGGGGVGVVNDGTFKMNGGTIEENKANGSDTKSYFSRRGYGGGVSVNYIDDSYKKSGRFFKAAGSNIKGNKADGSDSQVFVLLAANSGNVLKLLYQTNSPKKPDVYGKGHNDLARPFCF